jgi:hypothetical protein
MAELESLLFRKTRGELFDMPAYRDLLFLYSLARDLADREPLETGHVDVLLPISDAGGYTQPMSLEDLPVPELDSGIVPLGNQPDRTGRPGHHAAGRSPTACSTTPRALCQAVRHEPVAAGPRPDAAYSAGQPLQRGAQRLVLLGEAQPRDALLEATPS